LAGIIIILVAQNLLNRILICSESKLSEQLNALMHDFEPDKFQPSIFKTVGGDRGDRQGRHQGQCLHRARGQGRGWGRDWHWDRSRAAKTQPEPKPKPKSELKP